MEGVGMMNIFFDLDGTLIQSEFGIFESARYALGRLGMEEPDAASLRRMIGPPLYYSFTEFFGMDDATAQEAVRLYREHYCTVGMYKSPLYDGVEEVLNTLRNSGATLAVVTGKPKSISEGIIDHLKLTHLFSTVTGPDANSKNPQKADLITRTINELNIPPENYSHTVMVGDRSFDIAGAREVGIRSIGVTYGYGTRTELITAGADLIVDTPSELVYIN